MPQDPLARMGLSRSPIAKLFKPTPEQMEEPQMTEDMRSFAIQQQAIDTQLRNLQKQNVEQQNALAAEQAAQQYYQQPASARERFLEENQQALGASTGAGIYRGQMLQQRQATLSDKTLAPHIAKSIPVEVRGEYWNRITAGQSPTEAKDAVEVMAYNRDLRSKLAEVMSPEEINKKYGSDAAPLDPAVITYEISQRKSTGSGRTDPKMDALDRLVRLTTDRAKSFMIEGVGAPTKPEDPVADPAGAALYEQYSAAKADADKATEAYRKYLSGIGMPELEQKAAPPPAGAGAVTPPSTAAAGGIGAAAAGGGIGIRDTIKGALKTPEEVLRVDDKEILADLESPDADENTFMATINDPRASIEVKKKAAERMRQIAEKPKKLMIGLGEAERRKEKLVSMADEAEKVVRMYPEVEKYKKAWTAEKSKIEDWIKDYADHMGFDVDSLTISLAENEPVKKRDVFDTQAPKETYRSRFQKYLKDKFGEDVLARKAEKLEPFKDSEFAKELGMKTEAFTSYTPTGLLAQFAQNLDILPGGGSKKYRDVLDAYLGEKKQVAAQPAGGSVTAPSKPTKIKKVTEITPTP